MPPSILGNFCPRRGRKPEAGIQLALHLANLHRAPTTMEVEISSYKLQMTVQLIFVTPPTLKRNPPVSWPYAAHSCLKVVPMLSQNCHKVVSKLTPCCSKWCSSVVYVNPNWCPSVVHAVFKWYQVVSKFSQVVPKWSQNM